MQIAFVQIHVTVIYRQDILVAMTPGCCVKRVICKPGLGLLLGHLQIAEHAVRSGPALFALITVSNGLNETVLNPRLGPFYKRYNQRQSTHKCCQCLDVNMSWFLPIKP